MKNKIKDSETLSQEIKPFKSEAENEQTEPSKDSEQMELSTDSEQPERITDSEQPEQITKAGGKRKFSRVDKVLLTLSILLLLGAIVLFLWNPVKNYMRSQKTEELISVIEQGSVTIVVDLNAFPVEGEEYEIFGEYQTDLSDLSVATEGFTPTLAPLDLPEDVVLTALGMIQIDKIDLYIPLLDDAGIVPLRYGAGMLADTALPGQEGNMVVLGHRMKAYGSLFNRLDEVAIGDSIVITVMDGTKHKYIVDEVISKLNPSELPQYIKKENGTGKQLTLVTCTPTGVGSHRIIVIAHTAE